VSGLIQDRIEVWMVRMSNIRQLSHLTPSIVRNESCEYMYVDELYII